jgi:ABC-type branched-subunit amino acid transport system ATPase component
VSAALELAGVTKQFGGLTAVSQVDLTVEDGEIRGIVGPNGAGKTTLFNLISGLYPATSGRIQLRGIDVTRWSPFSRARHGLGRTYQTPQIFPELSLFENVAIGWACRRPPSVADALAGSARTRSATIESVRELLAFVELGVSWETRAGELSFARQKRLELARVLAGQPTVVMLDEPGAGLTRAEVEALADLIRKIRARGAVVCLIEHNMRFVMGLCNRITVLDFGRKIAEGTAEQVRQNPEVIAAYLGTATDASV